MSQVFSSFFAVSRLFPMYNVQKIGYVRLVGESWEPAISEASLRKIAVSGHTGNCGRVIFSWT
jgi:hypothetical protein